VLSVQSGTVFDYEVFQSKASEAPIRYYGGSLRLKSEIRLGG